MPTIFIALFLTLFNSVPVSGTPVPAPVEMFEIHQDGGLIYDPLRREAEKAGQLAKYSGVQTREGSIEFDCYKLEYQVPQNVEAYDVVPIPYTLTFEDNEKARWPVAVQATAFEDAKRRKGRDLFDMALPGKMDIRVEYLGYVTGQMIPGGRHNLKADFSDEPKTYPPFKRSPFRASGVIEAGDLVWMKFRVTNIGNTILDSEGIGGGQLYPEIYRKEQDGKEVMLGHPYNLYYRDLEYLYPGESREYWIQFYIHNSVTPDTYGLAPGDYRVRFRHTYRNWKKYDPWESIWDGPPMHISNFRLKVEDKPRQAPLPEAEVEITDGGSPDKITRFIHTFQEFMTAFDCHQAPPQDNAKSVSGTLYLQVAPWTKHITLKLISTDPVTITTASVPVKVDLSGLKVDFNPNHQASIVKNGKRQPAIASQSMADMRTNVQIGPYPEKHIPKRLKEMLDCGINLLSVTQMPWLFNDIWNPKHNHQGDAFKFFLDLARKMDIAVEGWGTYPFDRSTVAGIAEWVTGQKYDLSKFSAYAYEAVSHSDPLVDDANAAVWLYQFKRWGDLYYQMPDGTVPIGLEDSRGWMRQDIHIRYPLGDLTIKAFQNWIKEKYKTLGAVNKAWNSDYSSFDAINPEEDQVVNKFGHKWEYTDRSKVFHDWSPAVNDLDEFRTHLRVKNYKDTLELVRKLIPGAKVSMRTEGANVLVSGISPTDPNYHYRHIYYSQRRCGAIAEILQAGDVLCTHSDYTTMPYSPDELRFLTSQSVSQGIIPAYLPQFCNMRDIAINSKYGTEYQVHYNLPEPAKGIRMHRLTALFPWFKAVYESGGVPGILWEDYQCDGYATETQKREMKLFKSRLNRALSTPEGRKWSADVHIPDQSWRKGSFGKKSYILK